MVIFAVLFLVLAATWGVLAAGRLGKGELPARIAYGLAFGTALGLWLPALACLALGIDAGPWVALVAIAALVVFEVARDREGARTLGADVGQGLAFLLRERKLSVVLALALAALVGELAWRHGPRTEPMDYGSGGLQIVTCGYSFNDMPFHMTLANSFLESDNLRPPQYPPFARQPLGYPFVPDLQVAVLVKLGATLLQAFWLANTTGVLIFITVLWQLARRWLGETAPRRLGPWLAVILFLCSGGLGSWHLFARWWSNSPTIEMCGSDEMLRFRLVGERFHDALMWADYTFHDDLGFQFSNMVVATLMPSRCAFFGMILVLTMVDLLTTALEERLERRAPIVAAGLLAGCVPLVHGHSFLVESFLVVAYALAFRFQDWKTKPRTVPLGHGQNRLVKLLLVPVGLFEELLPQAERWTWFVIPALAIAIPQLAWVTRHLQRSEHFSGFEPGFCGGGRGFGYWLWYWVRNGGAGLLLVPIAWVGAATRLRRLTAPLLFLWVIANTVRIQPWVYDNIRLLAYYEVAAAVLGGGLLARWLTSGAWTYRVLAAQLLVVATLTGALSIARESLNNVRIADNEAIEFGEYVKQHTPPHAVFLTAGNHLHPVTLIAGRRVVLGYDGWLYTHGVNWWPRVEPVKDLFAGKEEAWHWVEDLEIDYVVVSPLERGQFPGLNEDFFKRHAIGPPVQVGSYTLYKLR